MVFLYEHLVLSSPRRPAPSAAGARSAMRTYCDAGGVPTRSRRSSGLCVGRCDYCGSLHTERVHEFRETRNDFNERVDAIERQVDIMMTCSQGECMAVLRELDVLRTTTSGLDKTLRECYTQVITSGNMANSNYEAISHDFDTLRAEQHGRIDGLAGADVDGLARQLDDMARTTQNNVVRLVDELYAESAAAIQKEVARLRQLGSSMSSCLAFNRSLDEKMRSLESILATSRPTELEELVAMMTSPKTGKNGLQQAEGHFDDASPDTFWHSSLIRGSDSLERSVGLPGVPTGHATMPIGWPVRAFFRRASANSYERDVQTALTRSSSFRRCPSTCCSFPWLRRLAALRLSRQLPLQMASTRTSRPLR